MTIPGIWVGPNKNAPTVVGAQVSTGSSLSGQYLGCQGGNAKKQWPLEDPFAAQGKRCKRVVRKELEGLKERVS